MNRATTHCGFHFPFAIFEADGTAFNMAQTTISTSASRQLRATSPRFPISAGTQSKKRPHFRIRPKPGKFSWYANRRSPLLADSSRNLILDSYAASGSMSTPKSHSGFWTWSAYIPTQTAETNRIKIHNRKKS